MEEEAGLLLPPTVATSTITITTTTTTAMTPKMMVLGLKRLGADPGRSAGGRGGRPLPPEPEGLVEGGRAEGRAEDGRPDEVEDLPLADPERLEEPCWPFELGGLPPAPWDRSDPLSGREMPTGPPGIVSSDMANRSMLPDHGPEGHAAPSARPVLAFGAQPVRPADRLRDVRCRPPAGYIRARWFHAHSGQTSTT